MRINPDEIKGYLVRHIHSFNESPVASAATQFKVTRATADRYLKELIQSGEVLVKGLGTRDRRYELKQIDQLQQNIDIKPTVKEEEVWRPFQNQLTDRKGNERQLCFHGLTE